MHSSILLFVVFMGVLGWGWACHPATPHPLRESAPLLALRATSPVPGESVLEGSLLTITAYGTCGLLPRSGGCWSGSGPAFSACRCLRRRG